MKYLCLVYLEETQLDALSAGERDALISDASAWMEELDTSGHHVVSAGLQSARTATTLRNRKGKVLVTDGPFAETKEQLGGFTIIDARDLNEAIRLATKLAAVSLGSIEVRPVADLFPSNGASSQQPDAS